MTEQERRDLYEKQTQELYAAIGRFAVKFEHVCHAMQTGILTLLSLAGLKNQGMGQAVLAGLTADPLRTMFAAVLAEICKDRLDDAERKIIADVMKRVVKLTESRNDVIHRMWAVGWASESQEDFSTVGGFKYKNTSKGSEFRTVNFTVADFDQLSEQADELTELVNRLWMTAMLAITHNRSFTNAFVLDADDVVRVPPG